MDTIEAAPLAIKKGLARYLDLVINGPISLLKGMRVTVSILFNPKRIVTQEYPENREKLELEGRYRGQVIMPHDEEGEHKCTGCTLCEKACPNGTISILKRKSLQGKLILGKFIYRYQQCTLCNLCVEACPYDAIRMGKSFEVSVTDRSFLIQTLNKKEGR